MSQFSQSTQLFSSDQSVDSIYGQVKKQIDINYNDFHNPSNSASTTTSYEELNQVIDNSNRNNSLNQLNYYKLLPDGRIILNDGTIILSNGNLIESNGSIRKLNYNNKTIEITNGAMKLLDNRIVLIDGTIIQNDGTIITNHNEIITKSTTNQSIAIEINADGSVTLDGIVINPQSDLRRQDGSIRLLDGRIILSDGRIILSNGDVILQDGYVVNVNNSINNNLKNDIILLDGRKILINGCILYPDGRQVLTNGKILSSDGYTIYEVNELDLPDTFSDITIEPTEIYSNRNDIKSALKNINNKIIDDYIQNTINHNNNTKLRDLTAEDIKYILDSSPFYFISKFLSDNHINGPKIKHMLDSNNNNNNHININFLFDHNEIYSNGFKRLFQSIYMYGINNELLPKVIYANLTINKNVNFNNSIINTFSISEVNESYLPSNIISKSILADRMKINDSIVGEFIRSIETNDYDTFTNILDQTDIYKYINLIHYNFYLIIHLVARYDRCEFVSKLVEYGCDLQAVYSTDLFGSAIFIAARDNKYNMCRKLLDNKVSVNQITSQYQSTPLHQACMRGYEQIVLLLLHSNASVHIRDNMGKQPFDRAVNNKHIKICQILLVNGVNIYSRDVSGKTALHGAVISNNIDMVKMLLDNGFDVYVKSDDGTPAELAAKLGFDNISKLLLSYIDQ